MKLLQYCLLITSLWYLSKILDRINFKIHSQRIKNMALQFYDSPFHVNHDEETANKMVMKMDLSIMLSKLIEKKKWTQSEAAQQLGLTQSRISDLMNSKIEKFRNSRNSQSVLYRHRQCALIPKIPKM